MMKTIRTLLFASALSLAACSSSTKAPEKSPTAPAENRRDLWDDESGSSGDMQAKAVPSAPAAKSSPVVSSGDSAPAAVALPGEDAFKELTSAIKSQNDDSIRIAAEKILARVPGDVRSLNALAMVYYRKGRFEHAAYLLGKAIQKDANRAELHSNLGLVSLAQNEPLVAVKNFRRAIEINPDDGAASANLGALYIANRDYIKARIMMETAYKAGLRDVKVLNNYGIALTAGADYERAKSIFQEGLKASSNHRELLFNYAILLVDHLNQYKDGLDVINRLKFVGAPPESRSRLASLENKAQSGVK